MAETTAIIETLKLLRSLGAARYSQVEVYTDSTSALYLFRKGSIRWEKVDIYTRIALLSRVNELKNFFSLNVHYINTEVNPADPFSRT